MDVQTARRVCFYVMAHADDAQLFMQPGFYKDLIAPETAVICIVTTAGDSGMDENYWRAREEGLKSSVRFCLAPHVDIQEQDEQKKINGHLLSYTQIHQSRLYFLRLPDGGLDGNGFATNNFKSLTKFRKGAVPQLAALDESTCYESWKTFCDLLREIVVTESAGIPEIEVHYLSPDTTASPNDHPDHAATGAALQCISGYRHVQYAGYCSRETAGLLSPEDLFWKAGMFAAYEKAVYDRTGYSTLREDVSAYQSWTLKAEKRLSENGEIRRTP